MTQIQPTSDQVLPPVRGKFRRLFAAVWLAVRLIVAAIVLVLIIKPEWPTFGEVDTQISHRVGLRQFDFPSFWVKTVVQKRGDALANHHAWFDKETRSQIVIDFVQKSGEIRQLTNQLNRVYSDPEIIDPDAVSADLQAEISQLRSEISDLQTLAEPILQDQVSTVLHDMGFGGSGVVFPPVAAHVTPLPAILIVSPRDQIVQQKAVPMKSGILSPERAQLEASVFNDLGLSAYVTDIGGLGFYPSLIIETGSLNYLAEVIAHEWAHHWFTLRPIGINYLSSPAMRTINESSASIVGKDVGQEVIRRYYPEFYVPPLEPEPESAENEPALTPDPNIFDFRREMGMTRVETDRLLEAGQIEEAEAYMEARRQIFVAEGYNLRVLNQAWFAFHGAYADIGGGAAGSDPVGPLVANVRQASGSTKEFMQNIAGVTSLEELQTIADGLGIIQ
ncbi:MAG: hypothetical protein ACI9EW_002451 [Cellvibrionaceae bacterium]